ncbi:MAG: hypothetical protein ACLQUR_07185, partial [Limisphaerales bacterium]
RDAMKVANAIGVPPEVLYLAVGPDRAGGLADGLVRRGCRRLDAVFSRQFHLADPGWSGAGTGQVYLPSRPLIPERGENKESWNTRKRIFDFLFS